MDSIKTKDFRAFLTAVKADGKSLVVTPRQGRGHRQERPQHPRRRYFHGQPDQCL